MSEKRCFHCGRVFTRPQQYRVVVLMKKYGELYAFECRRRCMNSTEQVREMPLHTIITTSGRVVMSTKKPVSFPRHPKGDTTMARYRLHTTGASDGHSLTVDFPYTSWREAYRAAEEYSREHRTCVVQADRSVGPRGDKRVDQIAVFYYGVKQPARD